MSDREAYSSFDSASARARKRQRQKSNQQRRANDQDALVTFRNRPTLGNALRAWLVQLRHSVPQQEHRSAEKFARALAAYITKTFGPANSVDYQGIAVDGLLRNVENFAWSLNVETTLRGDEGRNRSATSRIGHNFRLFIHFLSGQGLFNQPDTVYLLEACESFRSELDRTARVNRVMEEYVSHVQETHYSERYRVDNSHWCEYEVERISSRRLVFLRRVNAVEDSRATFLASSSFLTRVPAVLNRIIRVGDIFVIQICYMDEKRVWMPYMYSGFTPIRDDGEATPKGSRGKRARTPAGGASDSAARRSQEYDVSSLSRELARIQLSATTSHHNRRQRSNTTENFTQQESWNDGFDEAHFTEEYFRSWEGDIDSDDDILKYPHF